MNEHACCSGSDIIARDQNELPVVILVIGMAGCGKTTFVQRLNAHLHTNDMQGYIINLDPAVIKLPYGTNIDIRDTVNYKEVMKQYNLGPNGGILTSCNLFATRFDQVIKLCEKKRKRPLKYIIVDTPGQIEIFTWSASGQIVTELFASTFPTIVVYVVDTPRCVCPQTFMSNMLQACSLLYKNRLPLLLVYNKTDVTSHEFALEWMEDFEAFQDALESDSSYAASLSRSLCLVLDEFYTNMKHVGVSAILGTGMDEFFEAVAQCVQDYNQYYKVEYEKLKKERQEKELERQKQEMQRFSKDFQGDQIIGKTGLQQGFNTQTEELMDIAQELEEKIHVNDEG
eukprot:TRINITY_DN1508_c0_g3_i1.p1 TRINITY_DN1508_c0_g3~~TRINITY_DN1508_c0_g3_i1.p1  ORF type:complete len:342 (+),score=23.08 TRINITY_DN1508_c0_g3_i1:66-1091(+)